jgi:anti-anti-sigma regulatory factor
VARKPAPAKPKRRKAAGPATIALGADLRIGHAAEVFARIVAAQGAGEAVLDGSEIARIDAAGLQALACALVTLRTAGTGWRWQTPSGTLSAAAALAGLGATLKLE